MINDGISVSASPIFVNKDDPLFKNALNIKPIQGYEDIISHGDGKYFYAYGNDGTEYKYSPKEFVELIKNSQNYNGGAIRLLACDAGALVNGTAQQIANELKVNVLAPTKALWIYPDGDMFVASTRFERDGEWKVFRPEVL